MEGRGICLAVPVPLPVPVLSQHALTHTLYAHPHTHTSTHFPLFPLSPSLPGWLAGLPDATPPSSLPFSPLVLFPPHHTNKCLALAALCFPLTTPLPPRKKGEGGERMLITNKQPHNTSTQHTTTAHNNENKAGTTQTMKEKEQALENQKCVCLFTCFSCSSFVHFDSHPFFHHPHNLFTFLPHFFSFLYSFPFSFLYPMP